MTAEQQQRLEELEKKFYDLEQSMSDREIEEFIELEALREEEKVKS